MSLLEKVCHCEEERRSNLRDYSKVAAVARHSLRVTAKDDFSMGEMLGIFILIQSNSPNPLLLQERGQLIFK